MKIIFRVLSVLFGLGFIGQLLADKMFLLGLVLCVVFAYLGWREKPKNDNEKKSDKYRNQTGINVEKPKKNLRIDGYYICRFVADSLESRPRMTQIFIFNKKGYVYQEDWKGFDEVDEIVVSEAIIENASNTFLNTNLTKYDLNNGKLNLRFYQDFSKEVVMNDIKYERSGSGNFVEFDGKVLTDGLMMNSFYHHYSEDLKAYKKHSMAKNLKFDFIEVKKIEKTIINCKIVGGYDGEKVRIWKSTYLIDESSDAKCKLVYAKGIALNPEWTILNKGETINFSLSFEKLPLKCTSFTLFEDIPESGGFIVENIERNNREFYEIIL